MAEHLPRCMELSRVCYEHPDPDICAVASTVCWNGVISLYDSESGAGGRNRYDSKFESMAVSMLGSGHSNDPSHCTM